MHALSSYTRVCTHVPLLHVAPSPQPFRPLSRSIPAPADNLYGHGMAKPLTRQGGGCSCRGFMVAAYNVAFSSFFKLPFELLCSSFLRHRPTMLRRPLPVSGSRLFTMVCPHPPVRPPGNRVRDTGMPGPGAPRAVPRVPPSPRFLSFRVEGISRSALRVSQCGWLAFANGCAVWSPARMTALHRGIFMLAPVTRAVF